MGVSICFDMMGRDFHGLVKKLRPVVMIHSLADPQKGRFLTGLAGRMTGSWYVSANRFGKEKGMAFNGHMACVNPAGDIVRSVYGKERFESCPIYVNKHAGRVSLFIRKKLLLLRVVFHVLTHLRQTREYLRWDRSKKSGAVS